MRPLRKFTQPIVVCSLKALVSIVSAGRTEPLLGDHIGCPDSPWCNPDSLWCWCFYIFVKASKRDCFFSCQCCAVASSLQENTCVRVSSEELQHGHVADALQYLLFWYLVFQRLLQSLTTETRLQWGSWCKAKPKVSQSTLWKMSSVRLVSFMIFSFNGR